MTQHSEIYKYDGKLFRYDYKNSLVEWVGKADEATIAEEKRWIEKYNRPLFEIDATGHYVIDRVGLNQANWNNKEVRDEYLAEWIFEIDATDYKEI